MLPEARLTVAESVVERALLDGVRPAAAERAFAAAEDLLDAHLDRGTVTERLTAYEQTVLAVALALVRPADLVVLDDLDADLDLDDQRRLLDALVRARRGRSRGPRQHHRARVRPRRRRARHPRSTPEGRLMSPSSPLQRLPLLGRFELHRFKGRLPRLALVFVLLVPLLYGAIYLAANWDPYGKLDRLPVAVVNLDTGTTYDHKDVHAGDDFVDSLHDEHNFDYRDVRRRRGRPRAARGRLLPGDHGARPTSPRDLVSGQGDDPQRAGILLRRNDANGFVIGSITNQAQNAIARSVDESATASYFDAVFANLDVIRSGLSDATDGANKLHDGHRLRGRRFREPGRRRAVRRRAARTTCTPAPRQLATGLGTAETGSGDLVTGIDRCTPGAGRLADGADQVADGTQQLNDKAQPVLKVAARDLPKIERETKDVANTLDDLAQTAAGQHRLDQQRPRRRSTTPSTRSQKANPALADDPAFQRAKQRVEDASGRADEIAGDVKDGAARVHQANQLVQSAGDLAAQAAKASRDLDRLNDGAHDVASGAKTLDHGLGTAESGARTLDAGIGTAATGADAAQRRFRDAGLGRARPRPTARTTCTAASAGSTPARRRWPPSCRRARTASRRCTADEQDRAVQVLSSPADVSMTVDNPATFYGRGLAPLFFSIALWVFGISVFLVVRPISGRALVGRASAVRLALAELGARRHHRGGGRLADARRRLADARPRPEAPGARRRRRHAGRRGLLRLRAPAAHRARHRGLEPAARHADPAAGRGRRDLPGGDPAGVLRRDPPVPADELPHRRVPGGRLRRPRRPPGPRRRRPRGHGRRGPRPSRC